MDSFRDDAEEDAESWRISASSHEDEAHVFGSGAGEEGRGAEFPPHGVEEEGGEGEEGEWTEEEYEEGDEGEWEEGEYEEGEWEEGEEVEEEEKVYAPERQSGPPSGGGGGGGGGWLSRWWGGSAAEEHERHSSEGDRAADEDEGRHDSHEYTDDSGRQLRQHTTGVEREEEAAAELVSGATLQDRSSTARPLAEVRAAVVTPPLSALQEDQPEGLGSSLRGLTVDRRDGVSPTPGLSAVVQDMHRGASLADDAAGGEAPEWMRAALAERAAHVGKLQRLERDLAEVDERRAELAASLVAKDATLAAHVAAHREQLGALRRELGAAEAKERVATAVATAAAATSGKLERKVARLGALAVELEVR